MNPQQQPPRLQGLSGEELAHEMSFAHSQPAMNWICTCLKRAVEQSCDAEFAQAKQSVLQAIAAIPDDHEPCLHLNDRDADETSEAYAKRAVLEATDNGNFTVQQAKEFVSQALAEMPESYLNMIS